VVLIREGGVLGAANGLKESVSKAGTLNTGGSKRFGEDTAKKESKSIQTTKRGRVLKSLYMEENVLHPRKRGA